MRTSKKVDEEPLIKRSRTQALIGLGGLGQQITYGFNIGFYTPIIVGLVTWSICREMTGLHGIGKRKRAVVVTRSAQGEYATVPSPRPTW